MSDSICTYCESLPATAGQGWGGKAGRCPLCKQELWSAQGGATYRMDARLAKPPRSKWTISLTVLAAIFMLVLGAFALYSRFIDATPTVVDATPIAKVAVRPAEVESPSHIVQAKPATQPKQARVKPSKLRPGEVEPAVIKAGVGPGINEWPQAKDSGYARSKWNWKYTSLESLETQLRKVPEVDLEPDYMKKSKKDIAKLASDIAVTNAKEQDKFIRKLIKDRDDLTGMPFLLGKDCALEKQAAASLAAHSTEIRTALARVARMHQTKPDFTGEESMSGAWLYLDGAARTAHAIPALHQIMQVEHYNCRLQLVAQYQTIKEKQATDALINRALFDLDPTVRTAAVTALADRPRKDLRAALSNALRYPWQPVVTHAAQAIAALDMREMIPELIDSLDAPAPAAPFLVKENGKDKSMVRELVRVNHHRNCMLCHAVVDPEMRAAVNFRSVPVGPVPAAEEPLPPASSAVYYSPRGGVTIVRADVTYLRQDFSIRQKVDEPGKWSEMQRFDFLVRTREATPKDASLSEKAGAAYKAAILEALEALTGQTAAPTAQAWREAVTRTVQRVEAKVKR